MKEVFISFGSNLGNRIDNIKRSEDLLQKEGIKFLKSSSLYLSSPWGVFNQRWYINKVCLISSSLCPEDLLDLFKRVEKYIGREPTYRWGPRTIDIDILFYGDLIIDSSNLIIPHPHLHKRRFILLPLSEIAPDLVHPILKKSVKDLLFSLKDGGVVKKMEENNHE